MSSTTARRKFTKQIYSGNVSLRIDKFLLGGKVIKQEIVEHSPSVGIIPLIGDSEILFVSQFRNAAGKRLLEIPAGSIEKRETPRRAALREMSEEIGYIGKLTPLLKMYLAPGYNTEYIRIYIAKDLKKTHQINRDDDENIRIRRVSVNSAVEKCINGEIQDSKTIAAVLAFNKLIGMSSKSLAHPMQAKDYIKNIK
ncbi:NUDIX hydrolase [Nitrososphaera sp. AFS]|uniref:NUDIX hydrolase n=1 Tax=Nitrososphaera sp. AFS TaxID=2301191 RepID=UPI001392377F